MDIVDPMFRPISHKKVLAVEGDDENNFFKALLKNMGINGVDIRNVGGSAQFKDKLPTLVKASGFFDVEVLAIIRDAEDNATAAFKSARSTIKRCGLIPPESPKKYTNTVPKIGVYIMPGNSDKGMLEDLCMEIVKGSPKAKCATDFIDCILKFEDGPKKKSKAVVHAYLVLTCITNRYMVTFEQGGNHYGQKTTCSSMFGRRQKDFGGMGS